MTTYKTALQAASLATIAILAWTSAPQARADDAQAIIDGA